MKTIFRIYQFVNILSFDVAIGAMICALFFARLFNVAILPQGLASLGIAVWIIYTTDHLLDARRLNQTASTARHRFHQQHFKLLYLLLLIVLLVELILIFFLRKPVFYGGLWLGVGVGVYVLINRYLMYFKEVAAALLYSTGILLPVFSLKQSSFLLYDQLMIAQFVLIVLINLILFSWMDYEKDLKDSNRSLITYLSKRSGAILLTFLFIALALLHTFTISIYQVATLIFIGMNGVLLMLFLFQSYFKREERFRFLGDAIFFLPALALFIH